MAKKKKKENEFEVLSAEQQKKLQDLANEMIGIASNVIEEYEDLDIEIFDNLSGSLDSLNNITQIHEDSPFLNEIFEGESWKKVIKNIPTTPTNPKEKKDDTE
tara:strand:+ start:186 stop:494 length:309 start_codon:yes stop_codon:yes gene_type:complete